jgi:hypothetical protein
VPAAVGNILQHNVGYHHSLFNFHSFIIYFLLFSACSGSMREASCGSMMPAIINYVL